MWQELSIEVVSFDFLGLSVQEQDSVVWEECQKREVILVTGNRTSDSPKSLEATIRARNTTASLPVITIANRNKVLQSRAYARRTAAKLVEHMFDLENLRGTGRLYIP